MVCETETNAQNEAMISAFQIISDRLSNLENAEIQNKKAQLFHESCKTVGAFNNHLLNLPFPIKWIDSELYAEINNDLEPKSPFRSVMLIDITRLCSHSFFKTRYDFIFSPARAEELAKTEKTKPVWKSAEVGLSESTHEYACCHAAEVFVRKEINKELFYDIESYVLRYDSHQFILMLTAGAYSNVKTY